MVVKESLPRLRSPSPTPRHVLGDCRLRDFDPELEQLAVVLNGMRSLSRRGLEPHPFIFTYSRLGLRGCKPPASIGKPHTVPAFDLEPSLRRRESHGIVDVIEAKAIGNIVGHDPATGVLVRCRLLGSDEEAARHSIGLLILWHCRARCLSGLRRERLRGVERSCNVDTVTKRQHQVTSIAATATGVALPVATEYLIQTVNTLGVG
jgi:hypothetical protein